MLYRKTTIAGACLAGVALLAGCGNEVPTGPAPTEEAQVESSPLSAPQVTALPERVVVCQPGMVDTALTAENGPEWPGPPPSEFIELNHPSGVCGTLTGLQAKDVYEAAINYPVALLEEGQLETGESLDSTTEALWSSGLLSNLNGEISLRRSCQSLTELIQLGRVSRMA